jgi:hypothetical protein
MSKFVVSLFEARRSKQTYDGLTCRMYDIAMACRTRIEIEIEVYVLMIVIVNVVSIIAIASAMKRPACAESDDIHKKLAIVGSTRASLAHTIQTLGDGGWLTDEAICKYKASSTSWQITRAIKSNASLVTPYGKVVQSMQLPGIGKWNFVHPLAFLFYMATLSSEFYETMKACIQPGVPLKIILYIDEVRPGNPLRPEKSRTLQSIYWAFLEWPQWLLQRTGAWFIFGTLRSTFVAKFPGEVAFLMSRILDVFFPDLGCSFSRGLNLTHNGDSTYMTATLHGFLADEKALNQIGDCKGASGLTNRNI